MLRLARECGSSGRWSSPAPWTSRPAAAHSNSFGRDQSRRVMVLSLRAGGTGLNLTAASRVIHFDRWWNPAVRSRPRTGSIVSAEMRSVEVTAYNCADTVEERIAAILEEKRALFADLIDGVAAPSLGRLDLDTLLRAAAPAF